MTSNDERLRRAAEAGKRPTTSPIGRDGKISPLMRLFFLATYGLVAYAATKVDGWLSIALWGYAIFAVLINLLLWPASRRILRRKMLLAREQVHRVRRLDAANPAALGLGHLFDADPGLDKLSTEAGVRFTLARVNAVLDEVEQEIPKPKLFGQTIDDDGTVSKRKG